MKVNIEIDDSLKETIVVIRTTELTADILQLQQSIQQKNFEIIFYKLDKEYYFSIDNILFFEAYDNKVYAHTKTDLYEVKYKLYELEKYLPNFFYRISKSSILNTKKIYMISKSFSSTAEVAFSNTTKTVHISRQYYKEFKDKLRGDRR